jgi:hypothetical protein
MKVILAAIFLFLICAVPVYGIQSQDTDTYDEEKDKIIEKVKPIREEREKNLHPFVRNAQGGAENPFDYAARTDAAAEQETKAPNTKVTASDFKPGAGIKFVFILVILIAFLLAYFFIRPKSK